MPGTSRTKRVSLSDRAYADLRHRIVSCAIPPGAIVTENALAEDLGYGKTPTREALRRLATAGLVEPMQRRGYEVTPITVGGVLSVFEAVGVLLPEIAVLVASRATDDDKARLAELTRAWGAEPGEMRFADTPYRFFLSLAGNHFLTEMASGLVDHLERMFAFALRHGAFTGPGYAQATTAALDALACGDPDDVREAVRELTDTTRDDIIGALRATPSLLTAPVQMG